MVPVPSQSTDLRAAFRHAVSSTWVITSAFGTKPVGFTAISVVSVSVDPPIVSFNLSKSSSSRGTIERSGRVALHLLADHQEAIAQRFARDRSLRFVDDGQWHWQPGGLPSLRDYVHRLEAEVVGAYDTGDSFVVTARVIAQQAGAGAPLVHHHGGYRALDAPLPTTAHSHFAFEEASA